jgi:hypothetical protein
MAGCVESRTSLGLTPFSGTSLGQVPHCTRTPIEGPDARRRWQGSRNKPARSKFVLSSARLAILSSLRCNLQTWPPQRAAYYVPHYGRGPANVFAGCSDTATSDTFTFAIFLPNVGLAATNRPNPCALRRVSLVPFTGQTSLLDDSSTSSVCHLRVEQDEIGLGPLARHRSPSHRLLRASYTSRVGTSIHLPRGSSRTGTMCVAAVPCNLLPHPARHSGTRRWVSFQ